MTDVFKGMTRGVPGKAPRDMRPVTTEFADDDDIEESKYSDWHIFLGVYGAAIEDAFGQRYTLGGRQVGVLDAFSGRLRPPIPGERDQAFQLNATTDSGRSRPPMR